MHLFGLSEGIVGSVVLLRINQPGSRIFITFDPGSAFKSPARKTGFLYALKRELMI